MSEVKQDRQEEGKNLQQNKTKNPLLPEVPKQEKQNSETWLIKIIKITFQNTKVRQEFTERA